MNRGSDPSRGALPLRGNPIWSHCGKGARGSWVAHRMQFLLTTQRIRLRPFGVFQEDP